LKFIDELADDSFLLILWSKLKKGTLGSWLTDFLSKAIELGFFATSKDMGILLILSDSTS
jgi:hypothetical protein